MEDDFLSFIDSFQINVDHNKQWFQRYKQRFNTHECKGFAAVQ